MNVSTKGCSRGNQMKIKETARLGHLSLGLLGVLLLPATSAAQQATIKGSMSNFDVYNHTGHDEDEFDIECNGISKADIYSYYHNGNYGLPTATDGPGNTTVVYKNPQHNTADGGVEHFGIHTFGNNLSASQCKFDWKFNGSVVPPAPLERPSFVPILTFDYNPTTDTLTDRLQNLNTQPNQTLYVQRHELELDRNVTLNELMPANLTNLIAEANATGGGPEIDLDNGLTGIAPGGTIGGEAFAAPGGGDGSLIIYYDVSYVWLGHFTAFGTVINAVNSTTSPTPEPASMGILGAGILGLIRLRKKTR